MIWKQIINNLRKVKNRYPRWFEQNAEELIRNSCNKFGLMNKKKTTKLINMDAKGSDREIYNHFIKWKSERIDVLTNDHFSC